MAYNLMWTHDGDSKILNLTDDRLGHLRIVRRDRIDEWIEEYLKWYRNAVEEQKTEGSGFVYAGWIGFHIEMFPLRTFVGYKHHTPFVIGRTALNPDFDDNRCLQRCLILASEGGHTHRSSSDAQSSTRISMTADVCNGASFWPVKAGTRSSRIVRLAMQACTTSGGNNPTSTRYSE